jgi:hypothetical protein
LRDMLQKWYSDSSQLLEDNAVVENSTCRICFTENEIENPLVSVCKCSGSMKYIHLAWLKGWINSKKVAKVAEHVITYYWKAIEWELWKSSYSEIIQNQYGLLQYENPYSQYIVFETISTNNSKNIYLLNLDWDKEEFKIGRAHNNDIRVSDISVSRCHAVIKRTKEGFIINDNNAKFGTLVLLKKPLWLSSYSSIHLQVGRTLMQVHTKEKKDWSILGWLWMCKQDNIVKNFTDEEYLTNFDTSDSAIPREFRRHWINYHKKSDSLWKQPSSPKLEMIQ